MTIYDNSLYHLRSVAEFFFFFLGCLYALAYFFFSNTLFLKETEIFFRLADLPLLISGLAYLFLSLRIRAEEKFVILHPEKTVHPDFFLLEVALILLFVLLVGAFFVGNVLMIH